MLYPFQLEPVYKDIIWGGSRIRDTFKRKVPFDRVAESWEVTCREDGMSVIANGALKGLTLEQAIGQYGEQLLGPSCVKKYGGRFPLLVKLIDAADRLSVQVHPDDAYARTVGEENGKNEMWYVVDAKKDAKLVFGLRDGMTAQAFRQAVADGTVEQTLREVPVQPGDYFFIKAGTVHAILDGILIAEIQQNSNTTYRIYDWGRVGKDGKPRELHVDRAMDVVNFSAGAGHSVQPPVLRQQGGAALRQLVRSEFFSVDEVVVTGSYEATASDSFLVLNTVSGDGEIAWDEGALPIAPGDTLLLPACLGEFSLRGSLRVLLSGV